jgi:hypothetical protein
MIVVFSVAFAVVVRCAGTACRAMSDATMTAALARTRSGHANTSDRGADGTSDDDVAALADRGQTGALAAQESRLGLARRATQAREDVAAQLHREVLELAAHPVELDLAGVNGLSDGVQHAGVLDLGDRERLATRDAIESGLGGGHAEVQSDNFTVPVTVGAASAEPGPRDASTRTRSGPAAYGALPDGRDAPGRDAHGSSHSGRTRLRPATTTLRPPTTARGGDHGNSRLMSPRAEMHCAAGSVRASRGT